MNALEHILSFLGATPDNLGEHKFCLTERLALAYARRQGIDCIKESQLKWFAKKSGIEPELLDSFLDDVEQQVSAVLSGESSERP